MIGPIILERSFHVVNGKFMSGKPQYDEDAVINAAIADVHLPGCIGPQCAVSFALHDARHDAKISTN